ncbi:MAG: T9SS type A sorting domain-containing protein [Candidatus Cloacimonetes bacterium]|nr:T9SS type A sorting domain-containing protein [Candidatus Cloacimonadota bacterium]HOH60374.1 T9SS type A sorting domain-containing protein [Candidatus Cloacimonadota bacterium]
MTPCKTLEDCTNHCLDSEDDMIATDQKPSIDKAQNLLWQRGNSPNPFNLTTTISYALADEADVRIDVFDVRGIFIKNLLNQRQGSGLHCVLWNGDDARGRSCASGVYYYTINTGTQSLKRTMVLLK